MIEQHYGQQLRRNVDKVQVLAMELLTSDQWRVLIKASGQSGSQEFVAYVRIRDRRVLIEWEATVGFWSLPVRTYLALGSDLPIIARVEAELGDYYNYEFSDERHRFQCIRLGTKAGETLHGYVRRSSDQYDKLMAILSDGNSHSITLKIVNARSRAGTPVIQELLSPTWLCEHPLGLANSDG